MTRGGFGNSLEWATSCRPAFDLKYLEIAAEAEKKPVHAGPLTQTLGPADVEEDR
jgi:cytochrome c oxidase subunit 1